MTVVTDHDTGTIAWLAEGRCQETVGAFFDQLGDERAKLLTHVSADGPSGSTRWSATGRRAR